MRLKPINNDLSKKYIIEWTATAVKTQLFDLSFDRL